MRQYPEILTPRHLKDWFKLIYNTNDIKSIIKASKLGTEIIDKDKIKKGISENYFSIHLNKYFPANIYIDIGLWINVGNLKTTLKPDFLFYEPKFNFHLAIEIDEPYIWDTGEPIHYIAESDDKFNITDYDTITVDNFNYEKDSLIDPMAMPFEDYHRSVLILQQGWFLIRFSERQTILYPDECCKFIYESLPDFIKTSYNIIFNRIPNILPENRWSEVEAREFSSKKYRNEYLSSIGMISNETLTIKTYKEYKTASADWANYQDDLPL